MAALSEVVVLVTSQHVDLEWISELQCEAMRSNGTMGAISAGLDACQKVLQGWDRCGSAVDGAVYIPVPATSRCRRPCFPSHKAFAPRGHHPPQSLAGS